MITQEKIEVAYLETWNLAILPYQPLVTDRENS